MKLANILTINEVNSAARKSYKAQHRNIHKAPRTFHPQKPFFPLYFKGMEELRAAIEQAAFNLYNPASKDAMEKAKAFLNTKFPLIFNDSPSSILVKSLAFLNTTNDTFAMMFVILYIKDQIISNHCSILSLDSKLTTRNSILNILSTRADSLDYSVISSLSLLFCLLTKISWLDHDEFTSPAHKMVALQILSLLVSEMNLPRSNLSNLSRHRKIAVNFRDTTLLTIFKTSLAFLNQLATTTSPIMSLEQSAKLQECSLIVIKACLGFDFIGTIPDESSDELCTIQIPASWKSVIFEPVTIKLLFDGFTSSRGRVAANYLECLSLIVSTRRSIFSNDTERKKFGTWILEATTDILKSRQLLLVQPDIKDEFSRLLARLKSVNQLSELIEKPGYREWIELVAAFTCENFIAASSGVIGSSWDNGCIAYLLTFWLKTATAVTSPSDSARPDAHTRLEDISVQIANSFISARIERSTDDASFDATFEDQDQEQDFIAALVLIASIARCKYKPVCRVLIGIFDSLAALYQQGTIKNGNVDENLEVRFTVCVYIIGAFIGSRPSYAVSDENDMLDGELVEKVLQLMNANQALVAQHGKKYQDVRLDLALIYFFQEFRKSYVSDQSLKSSKVFDRLGAAFDLTSMPLVLNVIVEKIAMNLKLWPNHAHIIHKSITLFGDIASGYSSVKLLRKTDAAQFLLNNHTATNFSFLNSPQTVKSRMAYYAALGRLLVANEEAQEQEFHAFVAPFTDIFSQLAAIPLGDLALLRSTGVRTCVDALCRDLRGLAGSFQSKRQFMIFFDWAYPFCGVLHQVIQANFDNSPTVISVLRFFSELVQNKSQRLNFDVSSPGGILLFRETSKLLVNCGTYLLSVKCDESSKWTAKYKAISICFNILRWALVGKYVNFGVFNLYNDPAYNDAMEIYFRLLISIPLDDMMAFAKLTTASILLFQVFSSEQIQSLPTIDSHVFLYMMQFCVEGLKSQDSSVSSQVAISIDYIFTFVVRQKLGAGNYPVGVSGTASNSEHYLVTRTMESPNIITYIMARLLELVIFEDHPSQWTFTRALFPLVLAHKEYFDYYTKTLIQAQIPERHDLLQKLITGIVDSVEFNLLPRTRDKFTQNCINFRREVVQASAVLVLPRELACSDNDAN